jgi:hypothetical protein
MIGSLPLAPVYPDDFVFYADFGLCRFSDLHDDHASFDKLRMRSTLGGTKKVPHPELVEGRTLLIPA